MRALLLITTAIALSSCLASQSEPPSSAILKLNQISITGSHNSYKRALPPALYDWLEQQNRHAAQSIDYQHDDLKAQLDSGLRQLEIDVVADPQGGLYLQPFAVTLLQQSGIQVGPQQGFDRQALSDPGFKVLHIPDLDIFSHCSRFDQCLFQVAQWSAQHPNHLPIFVLLNVKEKGAPGIEGVKPPQFNEALFDQLDRAIVRAFPRNSLLLPADVRAKNNSLRAAVVARGWPAITETRGKLVFIFDGNPAQAKRYIQGRHSRRDRVMFTAVDESHDEAAIMVINDPIAEQQRIRRLVEQGFIVRTRADADVQTIEQMRRQYQAAITSGAQIISSDYYAGAPNAQRRAYAIPIRLKPSQ